MDFDIREYRSPKTEQDSHCLSMVILERSAVNPAIYASVYNLASFVRIDKASYPF